MARITRERARCLPILTLVVLVGLAGSVYAASSQQIELPDGFPENVPIYPNSEIVYLGMVLSEESYSISELKLKSPVQYEEVLEWVRKEVGKYKWIVGDVRTGIQYTRGDVAFNVENHDLYDYESEEKYICFSYEFDTEESDETTTFWWIGTQGVFLPKEELEKYRSQHPEYLPEDIPLYPNSEILYLTYYIAEEELCTRFEFESEAGYIEIANSLIKEFEKLDWQIKANKDLWEMGEMANFSAEKGERDVIVYSNKAEDAYKGRVFTKGTITYTPKEIK